jgi:predicted peroxiredoxin
VESNDSSTAGRRRALVVKVTAGAEAPERCSQGFTVASTAASSGTPVSLWLTGDSVWLATPGRAAEFELPHAAPLDQLLDLVIELGQVTVCTQCAARRELTETDLVKGVRIAGAASYVEEILQPDVQAIVY